MKKVLLMTSLCGVGRAGMYPQIAALTRAGIQACPLPTALFSTHTGGLGSPERLCVGRQASAALEHYLSLGLRFDALVTGYLPEPELADAIIDFVALGGAERYVCDPVMADGGKFYSGMGEPQLKAMKKLIAVADVIKPNATEAALLLGLDPSEKHTGAQLAWGLLHGGCRSVVVTGGGEDAITYGDDMSVGEHHIARAEGRFIGTGDLFTAVLTSGLLGGMSVPAAAVRAADEVARVCAENVSSEDWRYGMEIERI